MKQTSPDYRLAALRDWLETQRGAGLDFDLSTMSPASSDAGTRRYFRLAGRAGSDPAAQTLIAVDAPPPEKTREFLAVRDMLAAAGVSVPTVHAGEAERGFMLLSDLGRQPYLDALSGAEPAHAATLFEQALAALERFQALPSAAQLPPYDEALLRRELALMPEWYLGRHLGVSLNDTQRNTLERVFTTLVDSALAQPRVFVHRDFMPRNLMVLPGAANPGVLDFQDAVYGPVTYDVAALFRDAFIGWSEDFELDCIARHWGRAKAAGLPVDADFGEYYRQLEWMGLQRHLKILGLFARLQYRDGKPRYLADLPRFLAYVRRVASRYQPLFDLVRLLDAVEGQPVRTAYTF